jgi:hypothetical protein
MNKNNIIEEGQWQPRQKKKYRSDRNDVLLMAGRQRCTAKRAFD